MVSMGRAYYNRKDSATDDGRQSTCYMNHIVYITGGCDTTPNPEYPLGQKVTPDARLGYL
ncbi:hypothetical protein T03_15780 [Trichinella britovi]|uniref:Uncharacterized protein n=1 Tax=Trichinella britovi TaxID=45882 RepID=A0A0V1CZV2_TRIBR|nr:hypothetical protein T09_12557 [Trichinella sp. T9]KRY54766.1 hypothetical protein T03_15780 [Trichinella britovi]KRZ90787.1 hypothetical protein T08_8987 [Trichinella sp. T8]